MVTFIVGEEKKRFILHKQIVCKHSEVFKTAFNSQFVEGTTGVYELDDTSGEAFRMLVEYLYSENITFRCHNLEPFRDINKSQDVDHRSVCDKEVMDIVLLYILAERYLVRGIENLIIEQLVHVAIACESFHPACLDIIYKNTESGSVLRRLAVEQVIWREEGVADFVQDYSSFPHEMMLEMVLELRIHVPTHITISRESDFRKRWTRTTPVANNQFYVSGGYYDSDLTRSIVPTAW